MEAKPPLQKDDKLYDIADIVLRKYVLDKIPIKKHGKHTYFPITTQMLNALGLKGAENLGSHYYYTKSAVKNWIKSKSHNKNLMKDWTHTGVSVQTSTEGNKFYLQIFSK